MIDRKDILSHLHQAIGRSRVVLLAGPRQSGKTTLARELLDPESLNYFDLEDPLSLGRLEEPMTALRPLKGLVVIDEVQRRPELFPVLRVLADRKENPARFLVLGSATGDLLRQSSESLAGRIERITIGGFGLIELGSENMQELWLRGGFPLSFLARSDEESHIWRKNFVASLLERDFPNWNVRTPVVALHRFWTMIAHYHGQIWKATDPARALGVSESTARRHLDLLSDAFMVRQLQPYFVNIKKRQVKSPKVYIRDSGILHHLLGIKTQAELHSHPKMGASWEGFVIEQILQTENYDQSFFWATHQGAEIDLILRRGTDLVGIECKRKDVPKITPSIKHALEDLGLKKIYIVYPGTKRFHLSEMVEALPLGQLGQKELLVG